MDESLHKKEFLEYLQQNSKRDYRIFNASESDYTLFENELILRVSSMLDELLLMMSEGRDIISPEIHAFCIKEEQVNAFCFGVNNRYYIGIHSAIYVELMKRVHWLTDYLVQRRDLYYYQNRDRVEIQALLWNYAFKTVVSHEYMHIILGHCDTVCEKTAFLWENAGSEESKLMSSSEILSMQAMEMFADEFSSMDAVMQILTECGDDVEKIKYELLNYYFAVLLVFSIFNEYRGISRTHPQVGFRLHSIILTVDDYIMKGLKYLNPEIQIEKIDTIIDTFIEIIRQVPRVFSCDIVTDFITENFYEKYLELYNVAAEVVKITNLKAIYPVKQLVKMDVSVIQKLDSEKNILYEAHQDGLNYEEAYKLIEKK